MISILENQLPLEVVHQLRIQYRENRNYLEWDHPYFLFYLKNYKINYIKVNIQIMHFINISLCNNFTKILNEINR